MLSFLRSGNGKHHIVSTSATNNNAKQPVKPPSLPPKHDSEAKKIKQLADSDSEIHAPSLKHSNIDASIPGNDQLKEQKSPDSLLIDRLAVVLKTGADTLHSRVPAQLETFLKPISKMLIVSNKEDAIDKYQVVDVFTGLYERTRDVIGLPHQPPKKVPQPKKKTKESESTDGWMADAHKNLPALQRLAKEFPDADWYMMFDDDTYVDFENLLGHLSKLDPDQPFFSGRRNVFQGCDGVKKFGDGPYFAQGGSGIVLSRAALRLVYGGINACILKYETCWAGDVRTALCMRDAGVLLTYTTGFFATGPHEELPFLDNPCLKPFTFHHINSTQMRTLYDLSNSPNGMTLDLIYRTFFNTATTIDVGFDRKGGEYKTVKTALNVESCQAACIEDPVCVTWVLKSDQRCLLKKQPASLTPTANAEFASMGERESVEFDTLAWAQSALTIYVNMGIVAKVTDFNRSWQNGVALLCLIHQLDGSLVPDIAALVEWFGRKKEINGEENKENDNHPTTDDAKEILTKTSSNIGAEYLSVLRHLRIVYSADRALWTASCTRALQLLAPFVSPSSLLDAVTPAQLVELNASPVALKAIIDAIHGHSTCAIIVVEPTLESTQEHGVSFPFVDIDSKESLPVETPIVPETRLKSGPTESASSAISTHNNHESKLNIVSESAVNGSDSTLFHTFSELIEPMSINVPGFTNSTNLIVSKSTDHDSVISSRNTIVSIPTSEKLENEGTPHLGFDITDASFDFIQVVPHSLPEKLKTENGSVLNISSGNVQVLSIPNSENQVLKHPINSILPVDILQDILMQEDTSQNARPDLIAIVKEESVSRNNVDTTPIIDESSDHEVVFITPKIIVQETSAPAIETKKGSGNVFGIRSFWDVFGTPSGINSNSPVTSFFVSAKSSESVFPILEESTAKEDSVPTADEYAGNIIQQVNIERPVTSKSVVEDAVIFKPRTVPLTPTSTPIITNTEDATENFVGESAVAVSSALKDEEKKKTIKTEETFELPSSSSPASKHIQLPAFDFQDSDTSLAFSEFDTVSLASQQLSLLEISSASASLKEVNFSLPPSEFKLSDSDSTSSLAALPEAYIEPKNVYFAPRKSSLRQSLTDEAESIAATTKTVVTATNSHQNAQILNGTQKIVSLSLVEKLEASSFSAIPVADNETLPEISKTFVTETKDNVNLTSEMKKKRKFKYAVKVAVSTVEEVKVDEIVKSKKNDLMNTIENAKDEPAVIPLQQDAKISTSAEAETAITRNAFDKDLGRAKVIATVKEMQSEMMRKRSITPPVRKSSISSTRNSNASIGGSKRVVFADAVETADEGSTRKKEFVEKTMKNGESNLDGSQEQLLDRSHSSLKLTQIYYEHVKESDSVLKVCESELVARYKDFKSFNQSDLLEWIDEIKQISEMLINPGGQILSDEWNEHPFANEITAPHLALIDRAMAIAADLEVFKHQIAQ
ncbi:hypothetical protein HK100_006351 [Physocladia obscura]|uniref:N-acetylgalactosaminide beta-1,3-galactosyltransferase n=1 Tax=Physocladia obscura TaxID=109957 RepID=A0AAD5T5F6_9FUNG|nr:hypothetical protein HK100_006351 [Physocladia obscura]